MVREVTIGFLGHLREGAALTTSFGDGSRHVRHDHLIDARVPGGIGGQLIGESLGKARGGVRSRGSRYRSAALVSGGYPGLDLPDIRGGQLLEIAFRRVVRRFRGDHAVGGRNAVDDLINRSAAAARGVADPVIERSARVDIRSSRDGELFRSRVETSLMFRPDSRSA